MERLGHVGVPVDRDDVLRRAAAGLPAYWPTDPKLIDQTPYLAFAERDAAPVYQEETR